MLDTARAASTTTFVQRGIGDVLLAWENEAFLAVKSSGQTSSRSSCPRSASWPSRRWRWSTSVVDEHGTREVAEAYLEYLYSPEGQEIAAKHYYRPVSPDSADPADLKRFPKLELFTIDEVFGGWGRRRPSTSPTAASSTRSTQGR